MIRLALDTQALRDAAQSFAQESLGADLVRRDREGAVNPEDWKADWDRAAGHGALAALVPKTYGGHGRDVTSTVAILEGLGEGCPDNGLLLALGTQIWTIIQPLMAFGSEAQKARWLPGLGDGTLVASDGVTEQASGSDAHALQTRAQKTDGGYVLNGEKAFCGLAPACDLALVFASTEPEHGKWGLSAFVVERSDAGFEPGPVDARMGLRTVPSGGMTFRDCYIPEDRLLGDEGDGSAIFQNSAEWERAFIFAGVVGAMARQLSDCVAYAGERRVFGADIGSFQSVSNRLADMRVRLETSRLLLYRLAEMKDAGEPCVLESAVSKLHISEAFAASSMDAIRTFGGKGYLSEAGIERDLRDAVGGVIYGGTSDIQRQIIASMMRGKG